VVSYATGTAGNIPSSWQALGCPKGTWTLGSSTASVDDGLDNWCTAVEASIEGASPGAKTITLSGSMELIISDQAYQDLDAAEAANTYGFFKIDFDDSAGSNSKIIVVGGYITQW